MKINAQNKNNSDYSYIITGFKLAITIQEIDFGVTVARFLGTSVQWLGTSK